MPDWAAAIVAFVVFLLICLAIGWAASVTRKRSAPEEGLPERLAAADRALAQAHAEDRGWDRERLIAAARGAFAERYPGLGQPEPQLVQVIDKPGTEEDRAVFRFATGDGEVHLTLARQGDDWRTE